MDACVLPLVLFVLPAQTFRIPAGKSVAIVGASGSG